MKRRDLLKHTAALTLGLPALRAAGASFSPAQSAKTMDLMVTLTGPFCYWQEEKSIRVMAPPVGKDSGVAPHQAWTATHTNETQLNSVESTNPPEYRLNIPNPAPTFPDVEGTRVYTYEQGTPMGTPPLFNLYLPFPHQIVGVRPTSVAIMEKNQTAPYQLYAASWVLLYRNVELEKVELTGSGFKPCFTNDEHLPAANLGIFLAEVNQTPDKNHKRAHHVWLKMLSMYPWMKQCLNFDPNFNPKDCHYAPSPNPVGCVNAAAVGPGNDCEVSTMLLTPGGMLGTRRK